MAKAELRMAVDPFKVIPAALKKAGRSPPSRNLVSVDYDERADVLYARFSHGRIADSKALDENGMIMAFLDSNNKIVGLVVMDGSNLA